jgi:hypothetical protein
MATQRHLDQNGTQPTMKGNALICGFVVVYEVVSS